MRTGIVQIFNVGSTGAIGTIEFEPGLEQDLPVLLRRLIPPGRDYAHEQTWHDGNGHSHLQATLLGPNLTVPVRDGKPVLGTWQQIFHIECDVRPRERTVVVTVLGGMTSGCRGAADNRSGPTGQGQVSRERRLAGEQGTLQRRCMSDGAVRTEAVTISNTPMIVPITLAIHTMRPSSPCEGLLRSASASLLSAGGIQHHVIAESMPAAKEKCR